MALIREITRSDGKSRPQEEVKCTYCIVPHGTSYLLSLQTYGSSRREYPKVPSQTIQFDLQGAKRLRELIEEAFPSLK